MKAGVLQARTTMNLRTFCWGVGLTSGASLALSLLFTRIFSVTMYYHFAFLLVSLALLGIAVSGVVIYLMPKTFTAERLPVLAGGFAVAIGPLAVYALSVAVENPLSVDLSGDNGSKLVKLYFATALPFLASGFAISLAIAGAKEHIGRVYAFDLGGAALGCLVIVPLVPAVGGQAAVVLGAALACAGGVLLATAAPANRGRTVQVVGGIATLALLLLASDSTQRGGRFFIRQGSKFLNESAVEFERWNSFSRVTVSTGEPDHKWLHIDADAATRMYSGAIAEGGYEAPRRFSEAVVAAMVYSLKKEGPALIIGPGGGPDVISALRAGLPKVVGVEVNPLIADTIMREHYVGWNGDLYRNPRVEVHVDDGRSFIRRSQERYSSIQATLVDTWAASAAGAFTLSENNLYTAEAFVDYLSRLKPDGVLSMTRWKGVEFLRLLGLGREGLTRIGVPEAQHAQHFYIAGDPRMATMLLKQQPFTADEVAVLDAEAAANRLGVLYRPVGAPGFDGQVAQFLGAPTQQLYAQLPLDLTPVTDNKPFFFYTLRPADFFGVLSNVARLEKNNLGLALLQLILLISTALTLLLVVLPLFVFRPDAIRQGRAKKLKVLGFFMCLGFGYILVELGLMQRFILFLGHPVYALAVVLATLLATSGAGSALSSRLAARFGLAGAITRAVGALAALLVAYALLLQPIFNALLGLPLFGRIVLCALLVGALGLAMGTLLPLGVRSAQEAGEEVVPWAWGLNGATSVIGSTLSLILSMNYGFNTTLLVGLGFYALGAVLLAEKKAPVTAAAAATTPAAPPAA